MTELFNLLFDCVNKFLGAGGMFVIFSAILVLGCAFFAVMLRFFEVNRAVLRASFFLFEGGICFAEWALAVLCKHTQKFVLLQIALCIFLLIPIICTKKRVVRTSVKQKELIKLIDQKISEEDVGALKKQTRVKDFCAKMQLNAISNSEKDKKNTIDFTHVKSVIERLKYIPISLDEKKQVEELEKSVIELENGDGTPLTKSNINDGLGRLLKIMAKYGV